MDPYKTWNDCLNENNGAGEASPSSVADLPTDLLGQEDLLPPELLKLLREKEALERQLKGFSGKGEPDPDEQRHHLCFPVKVHTKESRIEERRLRRRDERLRMIKGKALQAKILAHRQLQQELESQEQTRKNRLARNLSEIRRQDQRNALLELFKRKTREVQRLRVRLEDRRRFIALKQVIARRNELGVQEAQLFKLKVALEKRRVARRNELGVQEAQLFKLKVALEKRKVARRNELGVQEAQLFKLKVALEKRSVAKRNELNAQETQLFNRKVRLENRVLKKTADDKAWNAHVEARRKIIVLRAQDRSREQAEIQCRIDRGREMASIRKKQARQASSRLDRRLDKRLR